RYPEREFVSVPALRQYWRPLRPLEPRRDDSLPDAELLLKRQRIETGLGVVLIRDEDRSPAALEIMARFAVDPRWLVYLPPTMSPCDASARPDYLEHPEGVAYYKKRGVNRVICEEKHMGSRAIAIVCKDPETAKSRFAPSAKTCGMIYSRTGRPFFYGSQTPVMDEALGRLAGELAKTGFWDKYATDWVCLDCEIMPWSYKAAPLIDSQYAPYGIAGINGLDASLNAIKKYARRMGDAADPASLASMETLSRRLEENRESLLAYNKVWRSYCAPATSLATIRIAPFHILATENKVWSDLSHDRHLAVLEEHLGNLPFFAPTRNIIVDLDAPDGVERATAFWLDLTAAGAEGMVVKPLDFIARRGEKLLQPAIKIRGKEYLRLIYGAAYADKLESFKKRELAAKRKRAVREFALGLEGLDRFVRGESLHKVHECAFTILALEGEPQDARL
ncbi:MAG: hypothetical protein K2H64_10835, partial [Desulfovibrio sp.]|nr:hypothetical protein [Desulfovibrio sp.]